jgi:hypothetical protein
MKKKKYDTLLAFGNSGRKRLTAFSSTEFGWGFELEKIIWGKITI